MLTFHAAAKCDKCGQSFVFREGVDPLFQLETANWKLEKYRDWSYLSDLLMDSYLFDFTTRVLCSGCWEAEGQAITTAEAKIIGG